MGPPDPRKAKPPELGGDTGASKGTTGLAAEVEGYGSRKRRSMATAAHLAGTELDNIAHRLTRCAGMLTFRWYLASDQRRLVHAKFCQVHLLCPNCAHRRAARQGAKVHAKLLALADRYDAWFLTLTVKNGPDLAERFAHCREAFRRLRERARDHQRGNGPFVEFARFEGLLWAFEVTHDEATGWHPHIHLLALLPKGSAPVYWGAHERWGESQLRKDWRAVTGDSFITHARQVDLADPWKAVAETVKYPMKFAGLPVERGVDAFHVLRGRRLMEASGAFRGVVLADTDALTDDTLTGAYIDFLYGWRKGAGSYSLVGTRCGSDQDPLESLSSALQGVSDGSAVGGVQGQPDA